MSLNYDCTKVVKGFQDETQSVCFMTMAVGMPRITASNAVKFAARVEMLKGGFRLVAEKGQLEPNLTLQVITDHIGLSTNANTYTDAQFRKRALAIVTQNWDCELRIWNEKFERQSVVAPVAVVATVEADEAVDSDDEPQEDCECRRSTGRDGNGDCAYCGGSNPPDRDGEPRDD